MHPSRASAGNLPTARRSTSPPHIDAALRQTRGSAVDHVPHAHDLSFASVVPEDVAHPLFDEMSSLDVVLDEEVQHRLDSHGLLQQLVQWTGEQMQCKQVSLMAPNMFEEMHQGGEDLLSRKRSQLQRSVSHQWCFTSYGAIS